MSTGATLVTTITSASRSSKWHGGFVMGERVDPNSFISEAATLSGATLLGQNVERIVRAPAAKLEGEIEVELFGHGVRDAR